MMSQHGHSNHQSCCHYSLEGKDLLLDSFIGWASKFSNGYWLKPSRLYTKSYNLNTIRAVEAKAGTKIAGDTYVTA